jgi:hypothetical protein
MLAGLTLLAALAYGFLAAWLARSAGPRWVWAACVLLAIGLAATGAARVGTANPYSRTARWDPFLFFVMAAVVLGAPLAASSYAALALAAPATGAAAVVGSARAPLAVALWSAAAFLAATPVGFVAAVAIEVFWPH